MLIHFTGGILKIEIDGAHQSPISCKCSPKVSAEKINQYN